MMQKKLLIIFSILCLTLTNAIGQNVDLSKYTLDWSDEFNGVNADLEKKWAAENKNLDDWHLAGRWRENVKIHNGILEIYNRKEKRGTNNWTSGSVCSLKQFSYGYFECRYMYAAATGTNNSFWLWPRTKKYAQYDNYELDINEGHYSNQVATNIHNWSDTWQENGTTKHFVDPEKFNMTNVNLGKQYHTYGFEWTATEMKWYFDGKLIRTEKNTTNHGPTNILLSCAILSLPSFVGPVTDAIDGTSMKVSYVRYYKPKSNSGSTPTSNTFYIFNRETGKKLRVNDKANGSKLNLGDASWVGDQNKWKKIDTDNGYFYLKNVFSGLYFRPSNSNDGAYIIQCPTNYNDKSNQWKKVSTSNGYFYLKNRATGKYFRPRGSENYSSVDQRPTSWEGNYTQWKFENTTLKSESMLDVDQEAISNQIEDSDQMIETELKVFPNPAHDHITVSGISDGRYKLSLFNQTGILVRKTDINFSGNKAHVNVSNLATGIYIIKVSNGSINETLTFIKK